MNTNTITISNHLSTFTEAFNNLFTRYSELGIKAIFIDGTTETPEFIAYVNAVKEEIRIQMNSNHTEFANDHNIPSNSEMVYSLREYGTYNYDNHHSFSTENNSDHYSASFKEDETTAYIENNSRVSKKQNKYSEQEYNAETKDHLYDEPSNAKVHIDDILDHLVSKIITKEATTQYYLKKGDASYALNSIKESVTNELRDMCKKIRYSIPLPKPLNKKTEFSVVKKDTSVFSTTDNDTLEVENEPLLNRKNCFHMVSLDSTINDADGNSTAFETIVADTNHDTESEVINREMLNYGINTFIYEAIKLYINSDTPYYLLPYLNNIAHELNGHKDRTTIFLANEINDYGIDYSLSILVEILCRNSIDISFLMNMPINWKLTKNFKKNDIYTWKNNSERMLSILYRKMVG